MQEQHLNQVHLSRLSPVMWAWNKGYPRKTLGVPIKPAYGMGSTEENNYEVATPINPKGSPIWSETWQQRGAGALKQRHPFPMDGCGRGMGETIWGTLFGSYETDLWGEDAERARHYSDRELQDIVDAWEAHRENSAQVERPQTVVSGVVARSVLVEREIDRRMTEEGKKQALPAGLFFGLIGYLWKGKRGAVVGGALGAFGGYASGRLNARPRGRW